MNKRLKEVYPYYTLLHYDGSKSRFSKFQDDVYGSIWYALFQTVLQGKSSSPERKKTSFTFVQPEQVIKSRYPHLELIKYNGSTEKIATFKNTKCGEIFTDTFKRVRSGRGRCDCETYTGLSFEQLSSQLNNRWNFIKLIEYKGYRSKESVFEDIDFGIFKNCYHGVYQHGTSHPERGKTFSKLEYKFSKILLKHNITFLTKQKFEGEGKSFKEADFVIPENNIVVEVDGLWVHCEKSIPNNLYHIEKREHFDKFNYQTLFFRENEIHRKPKVVESIMLNRLSLLKNIKRLDSLEIKKVDNLSTKTFVNQNSLKFYKKGHNIGLYFKNQLLFLCTFKVKKNKVMVYYNVIKNGEQNSSDYVNLVTKHLTNTYKRSIEIVLDYRYDDISLYKNYKVKSEFLNYYYMKSYNVYPKRYQKIDNSFAKIYDAGQIQLRFTQL